MPLYQSHTVHPSPTTRRPTRQRQVKSVGQQVAPLRKVWHRYLQALRQRRHHLPAAPQAVQLAQLGVVVEHLTQHTTPGVERLQVQRMHEQRHGCKQRCSQAGASKRGGSLPARSTSCCAVITPPGS